MVSTLLDDHRLYQDLPKDRFIRKLGDLFWEFSQKGDFFLNSEPGECFGCSPGKKGFSFIGNKSKSYINLVFITGENDHIFDIYECDEFCTVKFGLNKKNRLYLDKNEVIDFWDDEMDDDDFDDFDDDDFDGFDDPFFLFDGIKFFEEIEREFGEDAEEWDADDDFDDDIDYEDGDGHDDVDVDPDELPF